MNLGLSGKSALVLAASKGLGKACALALAQEGANVVIGSRDFDRLETTAQELRDQTGADVRAVPVDVTVPAQCAAVVETARGWFGDVSILVNNAGGPPFGPVEGFDDDAWLNALNLNLMSAVRMSRLVLPGMKAAKWGRIVNILSLSVKSLLAGSVLSTASRLGVVGMSKLMAEEVAHLNITVNNVASGMILTDRVRQMNLAPRLARGMSEEEALTEIAQPIPAKRIGKPEELAALVAFLASERAAYITGTTIPVDGGIVRSII
jgi:3-oxoacyl-[acyl-carrier protein] reductase